MRVLAMLCALATVTTAACSSDDDTSGPTLAGSYNATAFQVTPTGQAAINVLGAGGTLSITITAAGVVSGSLNLPASVTGGAPLTASMTGTAVKSGTQVTFTQTADTFVRDLTWTLSATALTVAGQTAGSASYSITLTRQ